MSWGKGSVHAVSAISHMEYLGNKLFIPYNGKTSAVSEMK